VKKIPLESIRLDTVTCICAISESNYTAAKAQSTGLKIWYVPAAEVVVFRRSGYRDHVLPVSRATAMVAASDLDIDGWGKDDTPAPPALAVVPEPPKPGHVAHLTGADQDAELVELMTRADSHADIVQILTELRTMSTGQKADLKATLQAKFADELATESALDRFGAELAAPITDAALDAAIKPKPTKPGEKKRPTNRRK
jgi:hypothetical protein